MAVPRTDHRSVVDPPQRAASLERTTLQVERHLSVNPYLLIQFHRPSTAEDAVVTRLQICVDIINIGEDVGISGETLHVRSALNNAFQHNMTEGINVEKSIDERRRESRAHAVWAMAMIAGGVVPSEAIIRSCVDLAVHDAIELAGGWSLGQAESCIPRYAYECGDQEGK